MQTLPPLIAPETARLEAVLRTIKGRDGWLTDETIALLAQTDRLRQVLVRCNGCRFLCAAQDAAHLIALVESGKDAQGHGDYVRDVSMPVSDPIHKGNFWTKVTQDPPTARMPIGLPVAMNKPAQYGSVAGAWRGDRFNENDCSGVYDGIGNVTSDADPGL